MNNVGMIVQWVLTLKGFEGYRGIIGGALLLLAALGLLADFLGPAVGFDPFPKMATTWDDVLQAFGLAFATLGIRGVFPFGQAAHRNKGPE